MQTKKYFILSKLLLLFIFQQANAISNAEGILLPINTSVLFNYADTSGWAQKLKEFKSAISLGDKNKVKSFFDFPLTNINNDIWQLVNEGNQKEEDVLASKSRSFTEKDFDKNYNKIFPKKFLNCISKLKVDELSSKGETETIKFKKGTTTTYQIYASIDSIEKTLTLALGNHKVVKNKKGEVEENEEFGTMYIFSIKNGQLKFLRIGLTA